jgi:hypothetical protein
MFERGRAPTSTIGGRQLSPRSNPHEASTDIRWASNVLDADSTACAELPAGGLADGLDEAVETDGADWPAALPAPSRKPRRKRGAEAKASLLLPDEQRESEQLPSESEE